MIINPKDLSEQALNGVLESFIHRDGTDYGELELSLDQKMSIVKAQINKGLAVIVYDSEMDEINILSKADYENTK